MIFSNRKRTRSDFQIRESISMESTNIVSKNSEEIIENKKLISNLNSFYETEQKHKIIEKNSKIIYNLKHKNKFLIRKIDFLKNFDYKPNNKIGLIKIIECLYLIQENELLLWKFEEKDLFKFGPFEKIIKNIGFGIIYENENTQINRVILYFDSEIHFFNLFFYEKKIDLVLLEKINISDIVEKIICFNSRIFIGNDNGLIKELELNELQNENYFNNMIKGLSKLIKRNSFYENNQIIKKIIIDESRKILYLLLKFNEIEEIYFYDILPKKLKMLGTINSIEIGKKLKTIENENISLSNIIDINILNDKNINLVIIDSNGLRVYINFENKLDPNFNLKKYINDDYEIYKPTNSFSIYTYNLKYLNSQKIDYCYSDLRNFLWIENNTLYISMKESYKNIENILNFRFEHKFELIDFDIIENYDTNPKEPNIFNDQIISKGDKYYMLSSNHLYIIYLSRPIDNIFSQFNLYKPDFLMTKELHSEYGNENVLCMIFEIILNKKMTYIIYDENIFIDNKIIQENSFIFSDKINNILFSKLESEENNANNFYNGIFMYLYRICRIIWKEKFLNKNIINLTKFCIERLKEIFNLFDGCEFVKNIYFDLLNFIKSLIQILELQIFLLECKFFHTAFEKLNEKNKRILKSININDILANNENLSIYKTLIGNIIKIHTNQEEISLFFLEKFSSIFTKIDYNLSIAEYYLEIAQLLLKNNKNNGKAKQKAIEYLNKINSNISNQKIEDLLLIFEKLEIYIESFDFILKQLELLNNFKNEESNKTILRLLIINILMKYASNKYDIQNNKNRNDYEKYSQIFKEALLKIFECTDNELIHLVLEWIMNDGIYNDLESINSINLVNNLFKISDDFFRGKHIILFNYYLQNKNFENFIDIAIKLIEYHSDLEQNYISLEEKKYFLEKIEEIIETENNLKEIYEEKIENISLRIIIQSIIIEELYQFFNGFNISIFNKELKTIEELKINYIEKYNLNLSKLCLFINNQIFYDFNEMEIFLLYYQIIENIFLLTSNGKNNEWTTLLKRNIENIFHQLKNDINFYCPIRNLIIILENFNELHPFFKKYYKKNRNLFWIPEYICSFIPYFQKDWNFSIFFTIYKSICEEILKKNTIKIYDKNFFSINSLFNLMICSHEILSLFIKKFELSKSFYSNKYDEDLNIEIDSFLKLNFEIDDFLFFSAKALTVIKEKKNVKVKLIEEFELKQKNLEIEIKLFTFKLIEKKQFYNKENIIKSLLN